MRSALSSDRDVNPLWVTAGKSGTENCQPLKLVSPLLSGLSDEATLRKATRRALLPVGREKDWKGRNHQDPRRWHGIQHTQCLA